jgi:hypothetical protein
MRCFVKYGVKIPFTEHDEFLAVKLNLKTIIWIKKDTLALANATYVWSDAHYLRPHQAPRELRGGWNQNTGAAATLRIATFRPNEYSIEQDINWGRKSLPFHRKRLLDSPRHTPSSRRAEWEGEPAVGTFYHYVESGRNIGSDFDHRRIDR